MTEDDKYLGELLNKFGYDHEEEKEALIKNLGFLSLRLLATFDSNGTQAILVGNSEYSILAFRGTEPTSFKDLKSDARANSKKCPSGGKIHSGFSDAYDDVQLLYSVNIFYRLKGFGFQFAFFKKMITDHSITIYRKKLMRIAQKRNDLRKGV